MSDEKKDPTSPPADDAPQIHVGTLVRKVYPPPLPDTQAPQGRVTEIRRHIMANPSVDGVCFEDVHGNYHEALRSNLVVIHEDDQASPPAAHDTFIPDSPDATIVRGDDGTPIPQGDPIPAPTIAVDALEVSMIRDAQRRLEVSQAREREALETIRRLRKELEEHQNMLANIKRLNTDAINTLNHERNVSREALESAEAQAKRGDIWQDAAHDALEQVKLWRGRAEEERAACVRIMDERQTWQRRAEELRKAQDWREAIERGIPVYNVLNIQMPPVKDEPTSEVSDD